MFFSDARFARLITKSFPLALGASRKVPTLPYLRWYHALGMENVFRDVSPIMPPNHLQCRKDVVMKSDDEEIVELCKNLTHCSFFKDRYFTVKRLPPGPLNWKPCGNFSKNVFLSWPCSKLNIVMSKSLNFLKVTFRKDMKGKDCIVCKKDKSVSLIFDDTSDVNHAEQIKLIIHFVEKFSTSHSTNVNKRKHLLGFIPIGESICSTEIRHPQLEGFFFGLDDMRSHDNERNMKGKHNCIQTRSLKLNPRTFSFLSLFIRSIWLQMLQHFVTWWLQYFSLCTIAIYFLFNFELLWSLYRKLLQFNQ